MERVAIAANFTAEPIAPVLELWAEELGLAFEVAFAPFDQVFQALLDPTSLLGSNARGVNVILLQLDRWLRSRAEAPESELAQLGDELVTVITGAARGGTQHIVALCPPSGGAHESLCRAAAARISDALDGVPNVHVLRDADVLQRYPCAAVRDVESDALGAIPYTAEYFAALGATIARRIRALRATPYKVLALDCDNVLWRGVVGELGPHGVVLDEPALAIQRLALHQQEAGVLVCLCSKNDDAAVREVFAARPDMLLRPDHIVAWRVNWSAKSANLRSLAATLDLGLDSFVFLDDSEFEVAEVRENAPEVIALRVPTDAEPMRAFLDHCWLFDRPATTGEDRRRTSFYRENAQRDDALQQSATLDEFLRRLELEVEIAPPTDGDFARLAQMTQRTNQFNASTIRRTEQELQQLIGSGALDARLVRVRDRFGDYGVVGLMLYTHAAEAIRVDTMLLSCRALGRRVEHRMLAELGRVATERGAAAVEIPFVRTARNEPMLTFLRQVTGEDAAGETHVFSISRDSAMQALARAADAVRIVADDAPSGPAHPSATHGAATATAVERTMSDLSTVASIAQRAASRAAVRARGGRVIIGAAAETAIEAELLEIWRSLFDRRDIGVTDNFFDLGGTSLAAVPMFARLRRRFGAHLAPTMLLQAPTVRELARAIAPETTAPADAVVALDPALTSLVAIQPRGSKPPLFCMHAGAGSVLFYYPLSRALGPSQPLYALQAQGIDGRGIPHDTLPAMAAHYIREIRTVQPSGPYHLAGFCLGATIAFEMAQQLRAAGESVALLASFDGVARGYRIDATHGLDALRPRTRFEAVRSRAITNVKNARNRALLRYRRWRGGGPVPVIFRHLRSYFHVNNHLALVTYRPEIYAGAMHVFMAHGRYADVRLGWDRWIDGPVITHEIAGELRRHRDLLAEPMVSLVARELAPLLGAEPPESVPAYSPTISRAPAHVH